MLCISSPTTLKFTGYKHGILCAKVTHTSLPTHTHTCIVIKCQDLIYSLPHGGCMQYTHIACIHHAVEDRLNHGTYSYTSWGGPEEEPEIKLPLSTFINHSAKCRMSIPQQYSWLPFCLIKGYQMFKKKLIGGQVWGFCPLPFNTLINRAWPAFFPFTNL